MTLILMLQLIIKNVIIQNKTKKLFLIKNQLTNNLKFLYVMSEDILKLMRNRETIRNIGIVAHIDHGKTTMTDNLLSGAGMLSEELAGKQLFMDFDKQEQKRGITIYSANVSIVYNYENQDYLINLIDTPGHVVKA